MKTITQKHSKATLLKTILSLGAIGLMGTGIAISATYNNHTTLTPNVVSTNKSNINTNTNADAVSIADMIPANTWVGNFINPTPNDTDILSKASTWASSQQTPIDVDQLEITTYNDTTGVATIQATDYAVDYIPGSSTTVKFNINQMEDLQTLFAGVVPTITQDRPTAAEMIKWLKQNKPDLAPIWGDIDLAYANGVMTLSASNNSVNYTGEVDVNVIPEIMQITDGGYSEDLINVGDKVMIQSKLKGLPTGGWQFTTDNNVDISQYVSTYTTNNESTGATYMFELDKNWSNDKITISAHYQNGDDASQPVNFNLGSIDVSVVPVTSTYFNFNGTTDTISGFSTAVIADYSDTGSKTMLNNFNTINFNNSPVKYMAGNASFGNPDADTHNSVFDTWQIRHLNLSGIKFDSDGQASGCYTFMYCNFNSLLDLNLNNTDFASCFKDTSTGSSTMSAVMTFGGCSFPVLQSLNLNGTIFDGTNCGATAWGTFGGSTFHFLQTLDLSSTIFMDKNNTQDAITSWMTFSDAQFDALTTLNLNGTSFANMGNTGQMTFYNASFPILKVLDISKTIFASDETKLAADATFCLTNLPSLTDIYLPDTSAGNWCNGNDCGWFDGGTFQNISIPQTGNVHWSGYIDNNKPDYFDGADWFNTWNWTSVMNQ